VGNRLEGRGLVAMFDIGHPAHVHLFKNPIGILKDRGWRVVVLARDKEVAFSLLDAYGIEYEKGTRAGTGVSGKAKELFAWRSKAEELIAREGVDVVASVGSPASALAARRRGVPHIAFNDTETGGIQRLLYYPASVGVYTPEWLLSDYGEKQERYRGLHDLSYLRPERFAPDSGVREDLGLSRGEDYAIARFVSWDATHDWGAEKSGSGGQKKIVELLSSRMRVFVSAESALPSELERYRMELPPERFHDALSEAAVVVGDGATTATEAAVLGTPSLYVSPFAERLGCLVFLESRGLLRTASDISSGLEKLGSILDSLDGVQAAMVASRRELLDSTIDVAAFIADKCDFAHRSRDSR